ncbi:MAG: adenylate/guanylate cyclase domain-containing protein, partial [Tistlia sp.]
EDLLRRGRANDAIVTLHRAVGEAASGGAPLYQALAERRIAELFSQLGDAHSAELAAWRAGGHFESWGAPAAARALRYGAGTLAGAGPQARFALPEEGGGTGELDLKSLIEAVGAISSELDDDVLLGRLMHTTLRAANADRGLMILLDKDDSPRIEIEARDDAQSQQSGVALDDCPAVARGIVELALRTQRTVVVQDAARDELTAADPHVLRSRVRAILAVCVSRRGRTVGVMYLENEIARGAFRPDRVELAEALAAEAAVALENARLHRSTQEALDAQVRLTEANRRFVPEQILSSLGFDSIVGVNLNEARERPMSVLFADLRGFTRLSAEIGPKRTIELVNRYLAHVQPGIAANRGFVANYFGDGLLALFPGSAEDALHGAVAMSRGLQGYNRHRGALPPLRFGLGIHSGAVILGTIGDPDHLQCSVMGDTVNVAARVEELTKHFGATLLLSGDAQEGLSTPEAVALRSLGQVRVAGRDAPLAVFECLDALPELLRERLLAGRDDFERAVALYCEGRWSAAAALFAASVRHCPDDAVSRGFEERCRLRTEAAGDWAGDWDGVERVEKALT